MDQRRQSFAGDVCGNGTLVEVNEHHTVIEFDEHGRKVFSSKLVTLLASSEPAPKKTPRKRAVKKKTDSGVKDEKPAKAAKAEKSLVIALHFLQ